MRLLTRPLTTSFFCAGEDHCFAVGQVAGAPHVPACYGAPGFPAFAAFVHLVWFGEVHGGDFVGGLELAEGEGEAFADSVVGDGEDVGAAEAEDEEHLDGPATDSADLREVLDDGVVGHAADAGERGYGAVDSFGSEIAEGEHLVLGEAGLTELLVGRVEDVFRAEVLWAVRGVEALDEALMNGCGSLAVELLVDDGFDQGLEGRLCAGEAEGEGAGSLDELCELGVGGGEIGYGLGGVVLGGFGFGYCAGHGC